ncbi:hypothetical protein OIO90_001843 [Microbotryomycetes sp. JL221]|nr:hypothetical protein OIO90_001843 [Microbotryomycetes sp. JL221]
MSHRVNNPFAPQPQTSVEATASRYPDVSGELQQYSQQQQSQPTGYGQYQQQPQATGYNQGYGQPQPQQQQQQQFQPQSSLTPQYTGFQPQSSFGQQLQHQQSQYGQQQQQYGGAGQGASPQVSFSVNDLDPYSGLSQIGTNNTNMGSQTGQQQQRQAAQTLLHVQQTQSHPRQYVHDNKHLLMTWDDYAWKQLLSRVDSLREGWEQRKSSISSLGNQGADPTSIDQLRKDADNYIDSCHAAKMQLAEVKEGWRHSTDAASKARVREALNAGLASLPEYPPALQPEQLGGAFHQRAYEDHRKQSIMSSFSTGPSNNFGQQQQQPQQQSFAPGMGMSMQPQQTGYYGQQQQQQQPMYGQQTGYGAGIGMQQTGYPSLGYGGGYPQQGGAGGYY